MDTFTELQQLADDLDGLQDSRTCRSATTAWTAESAPEWVAIMLTAEQAL